MTETPLGDVPGLRETLAKLNLTMQDPISVAKAGALLGVDETYNGLGVIDRCGSNENRENYIRRK